jgi:hypothetical protein
MGCCSRQSQEPPEVPLAALIAPELRRLGKIAGGAELFRLTVEPARLI